MFGNFESKSRKRSMSRNTAPTGCRCSNAARALSPPVLQSTKTQSLGKSAPFTKCTRCPKEHRSASFVFISKFWLAAIRDRGTKICSRQGEDRRGEVLANRFIVSLDVVYIFSADHFFHSVGAGDRFLYAKGFGLERSINK